MALNSITFLLFMAIVVLIYYIVPKKFQWIVLLAASYAFYLYSGLDTVLYIIGTTLFTYGAGLWMQKIRDKFQKNLQSLGADATKEQKKEIKKQMSDKVHRVQVLAVVANLTVLACVKYLNFFIENINEAFTLFNWDASVPYINLLVPLGLSYYTFNSIGYLIDIGRGRQEAVKNLGKFALFVSFFPSITQGPLFRYCDVGVQLTSPHAFKYENLKYGAQLMMWGFFKKMVIADRVSVISNTVFAPGFIGYNGSEIFLGVLAYSFQIYGDFSGGIDITRGAAQMLGIELPLNFERPFFATSMGDFWRRWHMSLGAWMREYVFYPVMLSKPVTNLSKFFRKNVSAYAGKIVPSVIAPLVVFFLMNIWHGLSWQRIVNGLYNAGLIAASVALTPVYKKLADALRVNTETFSFRIFQMLRTFLLLCISRIITKAPSLPDAGKMIKAMFTDFDIMFFLSSEGKVYNYGLDEKNMRLIIVAVMVLLVVGILQESGVKIRETLSKQNILFRWAVMWMLIISIIIFGMYGPGYDAASFIYGNY